MRAELTGPHRYYLVAIAPGGAIEGYAGLLAPQGAGQADIQTIAVADTVRRRGLGRVLVQSLLRRRGVAARARCSSRCGPTTRAPSSSTALSASSRSRPGRATTSPTTSMRSS